MGAFDRLSRFGSTVKQRAVPVRTSAKRRFQRGLGVTHDLYKTARQTGSRAAKRPFAKATGI